MKTTDCQNQLERTLERLHDLEAYVHRMELDGASPEQLRRPREELAAVRELCSELANGARDDEETYPARG
jgi:DNA mismatch repair ATPase MutS